jgi:hypothetical protein
MQLIFATYFCFGKTQKPRQYILIRKKIEPWVSYVLRQVKHCCVAKKKIGKSMLVELCVTDKTYLAALHSEARLGDFADV